MLKNSSTYLIFFISIGIHSFSQDENYYTVKFKKCANQFYDAHLKKQVYYNAEIEPRFPGGNAQLMRYLGKELQYPAIKDSLQEMQTSALVDFIVDTNGSIIKPVIVKNNRMTSLSAFDLEFLRTIKKMPRWEPGKCAGRKVPVKFRLQINVETASE
jgi:hypothetical protein